MKTTKVLKISFLCLLLLPLLAVPVAGCGPQPQEEAQELTIGCVMPFSGPLGFIGMAMTKGLELQFNKINEEGGVEIGGVKYKIKYIQEDSKGAPESSATATQKLVHQDGAKFVYGEILEECDEAIYQVCGPAKVLQILSSINIPGHPADIGPGKPFLVRLGISFDDTHSMDFAYLKEAYPNVKTIAISISDIGEEPVFEDAKKKAEALGFTVLEPRMWEWGTEDFVPYYTRLLADKPDAVLVLISGQAMYQISAARQLGYTGVLISNAPLGPEVILRVAGAEAGNDVIVNGWDPGNPPTDVLKEIVERWEKTYTDEFVSDASLTWDSSWILIQAMQKAQSVDPEKVAATLDTMINMGDIQTSHGPGRMGGIERFGVNRSLIRPIPITRLMNGQIETVGLRLPTEYSE